MVAEHHRQGSTPVKLIVDTRVVAEHHRQGSTPVKLIVDTRGREAPRQGSTLLKLIVDTYPVGCEAPPEGSTPVRLIMDEVNIKGGIRSLLTIELAYNELVCECE